MTSLQLEGPPTKPDPGIALDDEGAVALALARGHERQLEALQHGAPRDAIVACWLELEDAVRASGVTPLPHQTAEELTARVLNALDVDQAAIAELAQLYREARFSRHQLSERDRERARAALDRLHADLRVQPPAPGSQ